MRIAKRDDLSAIVAIYNSTIASRMATADTSPVSVDERVPWFQQHDPERRPLMVHEESGVVLGWTSLQTFYGRPAYEHTVEISIYLHPDCRGRGLGAVLLQETLARARELSIRAVMAVVFSHNIPSIKLFHRAGFTVWGEMPQIAEMDGQEYSVTILGIRL